MSPTWTANLELLQLVVTAYLCGVIWIVQRVHYPSFRFVSAGDFVEFHRFHSRSITPVVGPAMMLELLLSAALLWLHGGQGLWLFNFLSVVLIWAVTFGISVPLHGKLGKPGDSASAPSVIHPLVMTNWLRTGLWSLRTAVLILVSLSP